MAFAEVVVEVEAREEAGEVIARLLHGEDLGHRLPQGFDAIVPAQERRLRHRVAQGPRGRRVALRLVGVEEALGRGAVDDLAELPAEVHRVLHAVLETLAAGGIVDVGGVAGEEDATLTV